MRWPLVGFARFVHLGEHDGKLIPRSLMQGRPPPGARLQATAQYGPAVASSTRGQSRRDKLGYGRLALVSAFALYPECTTLLRPFGEQPIGCPTRLEPFGGQRIGCPAKL